MGWQRSHHGKFYYTRSRLLTVTEEGSTEEHWMYLDEYERREDFDRQWRAIRDDPELSRVMKDECHPRYDALVVPGSRESEVWTEVDKLRVEFK
jgi:hypothetical protein